MISHTDERVLINDPDGNALVGVEHAHASCVTCVELALAGLDAARAAQEGQAIHQHLVAGDVCEVQIVDLGKHQNTEQNTILFSHSRFLFHPITYQARKPCKYHYQNIHICDDHPYIRSYALQ